MNIWMKLCGTLGYFAGCAVFFCLGARNLAASRAREGKPATADARSTRKRGPFVDAAVKIARDVYGFDRGFRLVPDSKPASNDEIVSQMFELLTPAVLRVRSATGRYPDTVTACHSTWGNNRRVHFTAAFDVGPGDEPDEIRLSTGADRSVHWEHYQSARNCFWN